MCVGGAEEIGVGHILGADQVNLGAKQRLQIVEQTKKAIRDVGRVTRFELVKEIDIAAGRIEIPAGGRAEDLQALDAIPPA